MRRYTDTTIALTVEGIDITNCECWVTFKQQDREIVKTDDSLSKKYVEPDTVVVCELTQDETALFRDTINCNVQINWKSDKSLRTASTIGLLPVDKNLLERKL